MEFHPCDHTNDTARIRKNDNVVAINSALEIDLSGQGCADSIGFRIDSGIGGQMDFTTRGHVHWIVTEYGAVDLFGLALRQRAEALISIAHPDFRAELRRDFAAIRHITLQA